MSYISDADRYLVFSMQIVNEVHKFDERGKKRMDYSGEDAKKWLRLAQFNVVIIRRHSARSAKEPAR